MAWPANKWCLFWSGGWVLISNKTPDENTPCFDIKTHVCLYQNYNKKSKNLNTAIYCHQVNTILIAFTLLFLIYSTFTFRLKRHTSTSAVFHLSVQYAAKYLEPLKYSKTKFYLKSQAKNKDKHWSLLYAHAYILSLQSKGFNTDAPFTSSKCLFIPHTIPYNVRGG